MAEEIDIKLSEGSLRSIKEMRQEMKTLREEMLNAADPAQFNALAAKFGEVKDEIARVNEQAAIFTAGSDFEKAGNSIAALKEGLFNLDFGKAQEGADAFKDIMGGLNPAKLSAGFSGLTGVVKTLGSTFISLGKALLTNPIFLIGAVIAVLVVALYKLLDALGVIKVVLDVVADAVGFVIQMFKDFTDWLGITNHAANKLAEDQIKNSQETSKAYGEAMDFTIAKAKANGEETHFLEQQKRRDTIETLRVILLSLEQQRIANGELTEEQQKLHEETFDKIKSLNREGILANMAYNKKISDENDKAAQDAQAKAKAAWDKRMADIKKAADAEAKAKADLINSIVALENAYEDSLLTKQEREINAVYDKYFKQLEAAKQYGLDITNLEAAQAAEIQKIKDDQAALDLEREQNRGISLAELKLQLAEMNAGQLTDTSSPEEIAAYYATKNKLIDQQHLIEKEKLALKYQGDKADAEMLAADLAIIDKRRSDAIKANAEEEAQFVKDLNATKVQAGLSGAATLAAGISSITEEGSGAAKAAAVASTIISSIQGTQAAYASTAAIPIVGPALAPAAAGLAGLAGAMSVKKILAVKTPGKSKSSGSAGSASVKYPKPSSSSSSSTSATPSFNLYGKGNDANTLGKEKERETPTFNVVATVSETEITRTQAKVNKYRQNAEL